MVADYISTSFAGGYAMPIFVIAKPPTGTVFSERAAASRFDVTAPPRTGPDAKGQGRLSRAQPSAGRQIPDRQLGDFDASD